MGLMVDLQVFNGVLMLFGLWKAEMGKLVILEPLDLEEEVEEEGAEGDVDGHLVLQLEDEVD